MSDQDPEVAAIHTVVAALSPLDPEAQSRVIAYVLQRLGVATTAAVPGTAAVSAPVPGPTEIASTPPPSPTTGLVDIRSFTAEKQPRNANEMAAVVAYYLAEVAPAQDHKSEISVADIEKYFKQAPFRLPAAARYTLSNAKNAGYLDPGNDRGTFRLNPVGHNLVAHGLPSDATRKRAKPAKRKAKKGAKKKASTRKKGANKKASAKKKRAAKKKG